jgi:hypothetical protein
MVVSFSIVQFYTVWYIVRIESCTHCVDHRFRRIDGIEHVGCLAGDLGQDAAAFHQGNENFGCVDCASMVDGSMPFSDTLFNQGTMFFFHLARTLNGHFAQHGMGVVGFHPGVENGASAVGEDHGIDFAEAAGVGQQFVQGRAGGFEFLGEEIEDQVDVVLEGVHGHVVLVLEVAVDAAFGQARGRGQVGHGRACIALFVEDGGRGFDDELPGFFRSGMRCGFHGKR